MRAGDGNDAMQVYVPSSLVLMGSKKRVTIVVRPEITGS